MAGASEALHRRLRDPNPEVWRPACVALGRGAPAHPSWRDVMHGLLVSRLPEMRVRGLVALGAFAPSAPHDASGALAEVLQDDENGRDPVWLDTFFEILHQVGDRNTALLLLQDALCDVRDTVRAAAVRSLKAWPRLLDERMLDLADDSSVLVQAALASLLSDVPTTDGVVAAYERMAASSDSLLREYVAHELPRAVPALEPLLSRLAADGEAGVRDAALGRGHGALTGPAASPSDWQALQEVEARLDENPSRAIEVLRPLLELADAALLLGRIAALARRESVSTLCDALAVLCEQLRDRPREALREALRQADDLLAASSLARDGDLHRVVGACGRALALPSTAHIVDWSQSPDAGILGQMGPLRRACDEMQGASFREAIDEAREALLRLLPVPERWAVLAVLDHWSEIVEEEREYESESEEMSL